MHEPSKCLYTPYHFRLICILCDNVASWYCNTIHANKFYSMHLATSSSVNQCHIIFELSLKWILSVHKFVSVDRVSVYVFIIKINDWEHELNIVNVYIESSQQAIIPYILETFLHCRLLSLNKM